MWEALGATQHVHRACGLRNQYLFPSHSPKCFVATFVPMCIWHSSLVAVCASPDRPFCEFSSFSVWHRWAALCQALCLCVLVFPKHLSMQSLLRLLQWGGRALGYTQLSSFWSSGPVTVCPLRQLFQTDIADFFHHLHVCSSTCTYTQHCTILHFLLMLRWAVSTTQA